LILLRYPLLLFSIKETVFLDYRMRIIQSQVVATLSAASAAALLVRFHRKSSPPVKAEDISEVGRFVHQMELYLKRGGVD